jgi:uncharacterized protein YndB with AHSA1/START domain
MIKRKERSMVAISRELIVQATPRRVWNALTQSDEIAHWWTDDLSIQPQVGTLAEFRFDHRTFIIQFEVAELDEESKVYWITRQGPSTGHWKGTSVTWQLEPIQGGTKVVFTHDHFVQADRRYELTHAWWERFLDSLLLYLETGKSTIVEGIFIEVEASRIWEALTKPEDITGWWSSTAHITPKVGELAEFSFSPPAGTLRFEIGAVDSGRSMCWVTKQGPAYWSGTSVTWQLEPVRNGTYVAFTHAGLVRSNGEYEKVRENWRYFLASLRSYLEAGKGTPGMPPSVLSPC